MLNTTVQTLDKTVVSSKDDIKTTDQFASRYYVSFSFALDSRCLRRAIQRRAPIRPSRKTRRPATTPRAIRRPRSRRRPAKGGRGRAAVRSPSGLWSER
jgi:hypothetical protein